MEMMNAATKRPAAKPRLLIGLGNTLMGDDGIAYHILERLAGHPGLPEDVELHWGGADLLAAADLMPGRSRVWVLDAVEDPDRPGVLKILDDLSELETNVLSAHQLSAAGEIELLKLVEPELRHVPVRLMGVTVSGSRTSAELSPELARALPELVEQLLAELAR